MKPKRRRRSIEQRIADGERELQELRAQAQIQSFEAVLKEGRVIDGQRTEFAIRLREIRLLRKAVSAAERHEDFALSGKIQDFEGKLAESMASLVKGEEPSTE
jgi:hypothetical protein